MKKTFIKSLKIIVWVALVVSIGLLFYREIDPLDKFYAQIDLKRKSDLLKIKTVLEKYYIDNGMYPESSKEEPLHRIVRPDGTPAEWGEQWIPYMDALPKDQFFRSYVYYSSEDRQKYYLYASLERGGKDKDACRTDGSVCKGIISSGIPIDGCGGICNYGVSSRNVRP